MDTSFTHFVNVSHISELHYMILLQHCDLVPSGVEKVFSW